MNGLLDCRDLHCCFTVEGRRAVAVEGLSLSMEPSEAIALVGESGSGKSVTALSIMGLLSDPPASVKAQRLSFEGLDLLSMSPEKRRSLRGDRMAMIFQEPMTALNPVLSIERQIGEVLEVHRGLSRSDARFVVLELLKKVGMPAAHRRLSEYPHRLSGGMRQRVMIAMALACDPSLLIADEPTTALDVTIQAQIMDLLARLRRDRSMSVLLITHDLGVAARSVDRILVMYGGWIMEEAPTRALFTEARHPYTRALLAALPRLGHRCDRLEAIEGTVPSIFDPPAGCRFSNRCKEALPRCAAEKPPMVEFSDGRRCRCWLVAEERGTHAG